MKKSAKNRLKKCLLFGLIGVGLTLALLHIIGAFTGTDSAMRLFDLDQEWNVPTFYTAGLSAATAFLLFRFIGSRVKLFNNIVYGGLGTLFLYLAIDEALILHEAIALPLRSLLEIGNGSLFYHAWVVPALVIIAGIIGLIWIIKGTNEDSVFQRKILFILVLLAGGVVSLEILGTQIQYGTLAYKLGPVFVEEMYEISMVSTLLYIIFKQRLGQRI